MSDEHSLPEFIAAITGTQYQREWAERVKEADADAERAFDAITSPFVMVDPTPEDVSAAALCAIAAELRAARIARRPGVEQ